MSCIFCDIIQGGKPGNFIYEDENYVAFLDKYPIDIGHSLVMPRKHYEKILDMPENKVGELFSKISKIAGAIMKATSADAFSIAQNNGRAARQIVPHVHVHIIPRYNDRGTVWTTRGIGSDKDLKNLAAKIKSYY